MQSRALGRTEIQVSALCFGTMNLGGPSGRWGSARLVQRALDCGIDFFDTAPTYNGGRSEVLLGKALKKARRDDAIVATKVFLKDGAVPPSAVSAAITAACEASLKRLGRTHIDLYQLHRPVPSVPQEELLRAFDELVRAGKVRQVGCSTHGAEQLTEALKVSATQELTAYASEQPPYNLLDRRIEADVVPVCQAEGLALLPWSPLAGGLLAGRYAGASWPRGSRAARVPRYRERVSASALEASGCVADYARSRGASAAQFALAWLVHQPGVTAPIVGPRKIAHLEAAVAALDMPFSEDDRAFVDELVPPGTAVVEFA